MGNVRDGERRTLLLLSLCALCFSLPACRKPDTGRPDTGGPLVVVQTPDAAPDLPPPPPPPSPASGGYCVENWRVTLPQHARLLDAARVGTQAVLLLEQEGTYIAVVVGGGGQSTAAVLQDFVTDFVQERLPFGVLVPAEGRTLALFGWIKARESAALFGRVVKPNGVLAPAPDAEGARRRYFVAQPRPDWDLAGDPTVPESRLSTAGIENRFFVELDLWQRDKLVQGRVEPVRKHLFAIFGGTGKRAGGWDLRASRGGSPAVLGNRVIVAVSSNDRKWELLDGGGRRQQGPLLDALNAEPTLLPLAGGCLPGAAPPPDADGGPPPANCFALLVPPGPPASGLPQLRALLSDGTPIDWRVPPDLAPQSTFEAVADGLLWATAADGTVWAAGPDGVVAQRTALPEGTGLRRYSRAEILVTVLDAEGRPGLVLSCVPGGALPAPARGVALDGTVEQARRDAAGYWNESALAALDAIQDEFSSGLPPDAARMADLATFDDVRSMALRARQLDPDLLVTAMTSARAEILAFDPDAARREFAAVESTDPGRRDRLVRLACSDPRFIALRWHAEIGAAIGCPEVPPEWFVLRAQGIVPGAAAADVPPPVEPEGTVMPGIELGQPSADPGIEEPSPTPTPSPPANQVRPAEGTSPW